jgi:hypothetical protein
MSLSRRRLKDYLDHQQLAPFFEMSERYGKLYQRMVALLEKLDPDELDRRPERRAAIDELPAGTQASMWVDIDATITASGPCAMGASSALMKGSIITSRRLRFGWIRSAPTHGQATWEVVIRDKGAGSKVHRQAENA